MRSIKTTMLTIAAVATLAACSSDSDSDGAQARLPISLNEVMVALVNDAANPIWRADWDEPQTDEEWREVERQAYQIQVGGALLQIPGNGPMDDEWVADPAWNQYAAQMSEAGRHAVRSARAQDQTLIRRAGDDLVASCEACHMAFKPDLPTMDMFGELPEPPSVSVQ
ncbi:hypothetical protein [Pseudohongiella sp.]|uniref:Cytochrome c domain-containing protein n=1 Tax=marine sediment metagenome TaxID=412755 RepID=A0A0F9Z1B1_9ZZZZ|nr:hypothetical protein [Pseudohongiella sp.]HDZ08325.1 hypothetical protein [Pseudohongiella sp.]HEA62601.1 hypothetical protein [Pseudohongiella sp.]